MTAHSTAFSTAVRSRPALGAAVVIAVAALSTGCSSDDAESTRAVAAAEATAATTTESTGEVPVAPGVVTATSRMGDVSVTYTVPAGWDTGVDGTVVKGEPAYGVLFWHPLTRVFAPPCPSTMVDPPPGPTVEDFAGAVAALSGLDPTAPVDITIDDHTGKLVEFTVPDYDETECAYGDFMLLSGDDGDGYWAQGPNGHHQLRILDVDGTRIVIVAIWYPDTSAEDRAAIDQILESIHID